MNGVSAHKRIYRSMQYQDRHRESSFLILTPPLASVDAASATPITPDPGESGRGVKGIFKKNLLPFTSDKPMCLHTDCYTNTHINLSSGRFFLTDVAF